MKIVYVVGGLVGLNGMSRILCQKINYLAEHTNYDIYMILTEKAGIPWSYKINAKVKWVNFDINFDELDTMPLHKKVCQYIIKQRKYKRLFTNYLLNIKPDITISALRREINFINDIKDGSKKIGELHFERKSYRYFNNHYFPSFLNKLITYYWKKSLVKNLQYLDKFVILTHEDEKQWQELNNKVVIPNSIPEYSGTPATLESTSAIAVGRYTWQKGFDLLIKAWSLVAQKHPDWKLNIYGSGDKKIYQNMVEEMGLKRQITCHDATPNIYEKYMNSAFLVFSSRFEGFGLVLAEAMSTGLPVISFACPCGPSDIISNGTDGYLIEKGNIKELANAICKLINDTKTRQNMGNNAIIKARQFYPDNVMRLWINLFESVSNSSL